MATEKAEALCELNFESYRQTVKDSINAELQTLLANISEVKLQKQIEYALKTKGKRLRATLVFLSGESAGETGKTCKSWLWLLNCCI